MCTHIYTALVRGQPVVQNVPIDLRLVKYQVEADEHKFHFDILVGVFVAVVTTRQPNRALAEFFVHVRNCMTAFDANHAKRESALRSSCAAIHSCDGFSNNSALAGVMMTAGAESRVMQQRRLRAGARSVKPTSLIDLSHVASRVPHPSQSRYRMGKKP